MTNQKVYSDILLLVDIEKFNKIKKENDLNPIQTSSILNLRSLSSIYNYEKGIGLTDTVYTLFMLIFNKHNLYSLEIKDQYKFDKKNININFLPKYPLIIDAPSPKEIKKLRKEANLTQSQMAQILGLMGKQTISKYEKTHTKPRLKVLPFTSKEFKLTTKKFSFVSPNQFHIYVKKSKSDAVRPKSQLWTLFLLAINKHPYFLIKRK